MLSSLGSLLSVPPLRVAIVGAGAIGSEYALYHFGRATGTVVVSVVDCNGEAASTLASSLDKQNGRKRQDRVRACTDLSQALTSCDIVYIGTPPSTHCELAKQSLTAGCSVLLEKPLAASPADADALVAVAEQAKNRGLHLGLNIGMRWNEALIEMRRLSIQERVLGQVTSGSLELHFGRWPREWQQVAWCAGRAEGGPLREVGTHFLFGLQELFGSTCVKRVMAKVRRALTSHACASVRVLARSL